MPRGAKICQSNLRFCADLEDAGSSSSGLSARERLALGIWSGASLAAEQIALSPRRLAVAERHVAGLARRDREREAAQLGLHRIERRRLGVDRDHAGLARARDPGVEPVERAHGLVA